MESQDLSVLKSLQIPKFIGENFHLWKFKIELILQAVSLWDIVTGDEPRPAPAQAEGVAAEEARPNDAQVKYERGT